MSQTSTFADNWDTAETDYPTSRARVLLVDDEPALLAGLSRNLRESFDVHVATSGAEALQIADENEQFAVVISDMRMPGMDGTATLRAMREKHPDSVRMLLTGYADLDSAIAAVNNANIFRFLTKPTTPELITNAINCGIEQYQLIIAERELLDNTLRGSVQALLDTLALANPTAFARASRIKDVVVKLLDHLEVSSRWEIEVAAMLSQVGAVTLPPVVLEKLDAGTELVGDEAEMVANLPLLANQLIGGVARLEGVRAIIGAGDDRPVIGSRLLRFATDLDFLESGGRDRESASVILRSRSDIYGEDVLKAFAALSLSSAKVTRIETIDIHDLISGMVLADEIRTKDGTLLVARGFSVTPGLTQRIRNFSRKTGLENSTVRVIIEVEA